jgi:hypothetical protein
MCSRIKPPAHKKTAIVINQNYALLLGVCNFQQLSKNAASESAFCAYVALVKSAVVLVNKENTHRDRMVGARGGKKAVSE